MGDPSVDTATTVVTAPKTEMSLITRAPLLIQHCCTRTQTRSAVGVSSSFWVAHIFGPYDGSICLITSSLRRSYNARI